jgi:hypothetical protein
VFVAGEELVSSVVAESSGVNCAAEHGGEFVSPGAQGGEFVSPAKLLIARTQTKVTEMPSRFRFFMFFSFRLVMLRVP